MANHLSEVEYALLITEKSAKKIKFSIPKQVARQFFTRVEGHAVKERTGKSVLLKKMLIWLNIVASPLMFIVFMVSLNIHFGAWYSSFLIPLTGIFWIVLYGLSSDLGGWAVGTIPMLLSIVCYLMLGDTYSELATYFTLSIWLQRSSYLLSTVWLVGIVSQSYDAYENLADHITIHPMPS